MVNEHGFTEAVEGPPYVWKVTGPDGETHYNTCNFPACKGLLPCNCLSTRAEFSDWWNKWLDWSLARVTSETPWTGRPLEPWPLVADIGILTGHGPETP
jgi:hypothetical protein